MIGILVQRGLNPPAPPKVEAPPAQQDEFSKLLEKGGQFMQFMDMIKAAKNRD